ncbi:MAG: hypothetical protein ACR2OU_04150 [Thermomicrobiales bacterium]
MVHTQERRRDHEAELGSIAPEVGRAGLRIALLLVIPAAATLFMLPRDSAEFVITAMTLAIGLIFLTVVVGAMWLANRRL